jgi:hypothetical protein
VHRPADTQEARQRHAEASALARSHPFTRVWLRTASGHTLARALATIPPLCDEIDHLNAVRAIIRRRYQDLIAAARASLSAAADGEPDPLYYLHDELTATGHLRDADSDGRQRP